jgi:hypothetical protein
MIFFGLVGCSSESGSNDAGIVIDCQDKRDCPNKYECIDNICQFPDGSDGSDEPDGSDELEENDVTESDDSDPNHACSPWGSDLAFGTPILENINSDQNDWKPYLPQDGLTIWFVSSRQGGVGLNDFYRATRSSTLEAFADVQNLSSINTESNEFKLVFDSAGTTAFISTNRSGGLGGSDLWMASLESAYNIDTAVFTPMANVNSDQDEWDVFLTADDLQLFFNRENQIYFAMRADTQSLFQTPQPLGDEINLGSAGSPSLTADGLVLVFSSSREGSIGGSDIWYATRSDTSQSFSSPQLVPGVNTADIEVDPFVTPDGCTLYFARGPQNLYDLYVTHIER